MSKRTNNLKKRITALMELQADLERWKAGVNAAAARVRALEDQLKRHAALTIHTDHPVDARNRYLKSLTVTFSPEYFARDFYSRSIGKVDDLSFYAHSIGREAGEKIAAEIVRQLTGETTHA